MEHVLKMFSLCHLNLTNVTSTHSHIIGKIVHFLFLSKSEGPMVAVWPLMLSDCNGLIPLLMPTSESVTPAGTWECTAKE